MGNCCCLIRDKNKQQIGQNTKKTIRTTQPSNKSVKGKKSNKNFYKYGDDEYDNDDYEVETLDYERLTTKSDISSSKSSQNRSRNSLVDKNKINRNNRLLDKALLNQHHKNLQQQYGNNQQQLITSSSTILLLQQSHLTNNTSNFKQNLYLNKNKNLAPASGQATTVDRFNNSSYYNNRRCVDNSNLKLGLNSNEENLGLLNCIDQSHKGKNH